MDYKLHALLDGFVVFTSSTGQIISEPITQDAKQVLDWYSKNVPANDNC